MIGYIMPDLVGLKVLSHVYRGDLYERMKADGIK